LAGPAAVTAVPPAKQRDFLSVKLPALFWQKQSEHHTCERRGVVRSACGSECSHRKVGCAKA